MAVESTNFIDEMRNVYNMIGKATLAPDADMDFASKLQMVIRGYLMNGAGQMAGPGGGGGMPGGGPGGGGGPSGATPGTPNGLGGGGMGLSPATPGAPPGGMGMNPGMGGPAEAVNGDELRRILGGAVQ